MINGSGSSLSTLRFRIRYLVVFRFVVFFFFPSTFFVFFSPLFFLRDYSGLQPEKEAHRTENHEKKKESHDDKEVKPVLLAIHWPMFCIFFFCLSRHWYFTAQCNSKGRMVPLLLRFHRFLACLSHLLRIHLSHSWKGQENIKSSHQSQMTLCITLHPQKKKTLSRQMTFYRKMEAGPNVNGFSANVNNSTQSHISIIGG